MKYSVDKKESYSILTLEEDNLNSIIAPDLKSEFVFLRNEGVKNLIFDMSGIKYVDSSGLSSILTANRIWKGYGNFIVSGVVHESVEKLIKISRLDTILKLIPSLDESIEFVLKSQVENLEGESE